MYKLVISDDEGKNTVVPLVRDEITIGRKEGNTIRLTERNVSRRHARLVKANGRFAVEDLRSYNGVRVNGQRIGAETALDAGDQIQIGDYQIALQIDGTEAATLPEQVSPLVADADTAMLASPGPPARLVMITPPAPGAEFAITSERVRIGRAEDLEIWVNHRSISREHAEVQKEPDGGLRLIDLGSANGVRVNNQDVQNALLAPGDVVELGQVRFRFVGAGEHYAFDSDRTVQMDALTIERPRSDNRLPLFIAVGIVLVAVLGAGIVAFWSGGDREPTVRQLEGNSAHGEDTTLPNVAPAHGYDAALAACRAAFGQSQFAQAITHADVALAERPADETATACRAQAEQGQAFERGAGLLAQGDLPGAYFEFENLPDTSPFRARPQVTQAVQGYANSQINAGQQMLSSAPGEALSLAQFVLNMRGISADQRALASALEREAQRRGATTGQVASRIRPPPSGTNPRPPTPRITSPRLPVAANPRTPQGTSETPRGTGAAPDEGGGDVEAEARACTMSGNNGCVVRLLEGRARTERTLGMLIEAYRAQGQTQQALRHMRTYVTRFPGTPRARQYQQILANHGS